MCQSGPLEPATVSPSTAALTQAASATISPAVAENMVPSSKTAMDASTRCGRTKTATARLQCIPRTGVIVSRLQTTAQPMPFTWPVEVLRFPSFAKWPVRDPGLRNCAVFDVLSAWRCERPLGNREQRLVLFGF